MATWIRAAFGSSPDTLFNYINLDHVKQAQVIATLGGPSGYCIELDYEGTALGYVYGRWDTAAEANAALQLLVRGSDLSDTAGEVV